MRELWIYSKLELFFIMPYSAKKKGVEEDSVVGKSTRNQQVVLMESPPAGKKNKPKDKHR
jgi:hypothetical protein